jgi:hypothetical protein
MQGSQSSWHACGAGRNQGSNLQLLRHCLPVAHYLTTSDTCSRNAAAPPVPFGRRGVGRLAV